MLRSLLARVLAWAIHPTDCCPHCGWETDE